MGKIPSNKCVLSSTVESRFSKPNVIGSNPIGRKRGSLSVKGAHQISRLWAFSGAVFKSAGLLSRGMLD